MTQTRCHSVFQTHSLSVLFHDRFVATEGTANFEPLLFRACNASSTSLGMP